MNTEACKFDFMAKRAPCLNLVSLISPYREADPRAGTIMYNHLQHLRGLQHTGEQLWGKCSHCNNSKV